MPRIAQVVGVGLPHHITQRGNYRQAVFDDDRNQYLSWIEGYSQRYHLTILAYCLMENHVHFVVIPGRIDSMAKTFNTAHMRYAQYFNKKRKVSDHLWQGRFYSCVLDEPHLMVAVKYIERNPVRAKLVRKPWLWEWSSARAHIDRDVQSIIKVDEFFKIIDMSYDTWRDYLQDQDDAKAMAEIRQNTLTGRPLGSIKFVYKLEKRFGRRLHALPKGRPKRKN